MRPILRPATPVNQIFPSGPAVIVAGFEWAVRPCEKVRTCPVTLTRAIRPRWSVTPRLTDAAPTERLRAQPDCWDEGQARQSGAINASAALESDVVAYAAQ